MLRPLAALVIAATTLLAGCAARRPSIPVTEARARIVGDTAAQVSACMGPAAVQRTRGGVALWSYPSATATAAAPATLSDPSSATFQYTPLDGDPLGGGLGAGALGVGEGPAAPAGCIVNVTLDGGVARAVTYVGPNGRLLRDDPECSQLVRACVR